MSEQRARISRRISSVAESATLAIDAKAKALKASGVDVIGFGAGEPDFPTPTNIVEAAAKACADPRNHRYTPAAGLPELREAIAAKTKRDSGYEITAGNTVVTNGGKHAIYNAFATILDPGDEVLIPEPYWTTYPEAVKLAGGVPVFVPSTLEGGFKVTPADLDRYRTGRTKMALFVSPSNPSGAVYNEDETRNFAEFCATNDLWIMSDEIYEHLTYDGEVAHSVVNYDPRGLENIIVVNGVAKTYAMTGWRVGWIVAAIERVKEIKESGRYIPPALDLSIALENSVLNQTYNTPALATIFLMNEQIKWINGNGGLPFSTERSAKSSGIVYSWAIASDFATPFVQDPKMRSNVVATIDFDENIDASSVARVLRKNGIVDVEPYRKLGRNQLRIATFPAVDPSDVEALVASINYVVSKF